MGTKKRSKMARQLQLYNIIAQIRSGAVYSPAELMDSFGISLRMLQRDLKDLRDCGLINVSFKKSENKYVIAGEAVFDESAAARRKQHLTRLYRIGTLIVSLSRTDPDELEDYEYGLKQFNDYLEDVKADPENNPLEDIEDMRIFYLPHELEFYDLKAEYYALFPESNERTRQRDFEEMTCAGFTIYYSRKYKSFIFKCS